MAATNKPAFLYVLDRKTGTPVWPIPERPVPQSTAPNRERTSPTQPIPSKIPSLDYVGATPDNVIDLTPGLKARGLEQLQHFEYGPVYTPPSVKGTLKVPSSLGGANWGGFAFDPDTGVLYMPTRTTMEVARARFPKGGPQQPVQPTAAGAAPEQPDLNRLLYVDGLPLIKPPYARVTAIDMNKGERLWMTPLGNGPRNHPLLKDLRLPPLGDAVYGAAPLLTKTLLFVGVTNLLVNSAPSTMPWQQWSDPGWERKLLYVFDKKSGAILHTIEMDGLSTAAPMTYMHDGNQYIVVAASGGPDSELVAFRLP